MASKDASDSELPGGNSSQSSKKESFIRNYRTATMDITFISEDLSEEQFEVVYNGFKRGWSNGLGSCGKIKPKKKTGESSRPDPDISDKGSDSGQRTKNSKKSKGRSTKK